MIRLPDSPQKLDMALASLSTFDLTFSLLRSGYMQITYLSTRQHMGFIQLGGSRA